MVAFSLGYFVSEFDANVPSILLLATSSLVASVAVALVTSVERSFDRTPSALVALVTSLFKLVVIVASALVRLVVSAERFVVNISSALVALIISAARSDEPVFAIAST